MLRNQGSTLASGQDVDLLAGARKQASVKPCILVRLVVQEVGVVLSYLHHHPAALGGPNPILVLVAILQAVTAQLAHTGQLVKY